MTQAPPPPTPPLPQVLMQMMMGKFVSRSLGLVAELGVADVLKDGPRTAEDIATATGSNPDALYRVLRAMASTGLFVEAPHGTFALTPMSELLRSDVQGSMRAMARWIASDRAGWQAWGDLSHSVKTGEPAFDAAHGVKVFEHFAKNPESGAVFDAAMTSNSAMTAHAVAEAYDFSSIGTLVDVGGSQGGLLLAIKQRYPSVRGINFDMPHVIERTRGVLEAANQAGALELIAGDFFSAVPPADAYIMKTVIHDWSDDLAAKILGNCRKNLDANGKVLVVEGLVNDDPAAGFVKFLDLEMLVMTSGGRERTQEQFEALFAKAGLRLARVVPTKSPAVVLEGVVA